MLHTNPVSSTYAGRSSCMWLLCLYFLQKAARFRARPPEEQARLRERQAIAHSRGFQSTKAMVAAYVAANAALEAEEAGEGADDDDDDDDGGFGSGRRAPPRPRSRGTASGSGSGSGVGFGSRSSAAGRAGRGGGTGHRPARPGTDDDGPRAGKPRAGMCGPAGAGLHGVAWSTASQRHAPVGRCTEFCCRRSAAR